MEPLDNLVVDVKTVLDELKPLNAGAILKAGVKLCVSSKTLVGLPYEEKLKLLAKAMAKGLEELKAKELASAAEDQKKTIAERYTHLILVADSGLSSTLELVFDIFQGRVNLSTLIGQVKPSSWFRWVSCITSSAISAVAATGIVSADQAKQAGDILKKVEDLPKQVEEIADKAEDVLADVKAAVPALAPAVDAVAGVAQSVESAASSLVEPVVLPTVVVDLSGAEVAAQSSPAEISPVENKQ
jgi:hypothetical protein